MQTQKRTKQDTGIKDKITGKNQGKDRIRQEQNRVRQNNIIMNNNNKRKGNNSAWTEVLNTFKSYIA